jgi:hypothetical protein
MPIAHYNYYPPANSVFDADNVQAKWDGRAWRVNGAVYTVPNGHRLAGLPGPLYGWTYDWQKRAWMEPGNAPAPTPSAPAKPAPGPFTMGPVGPHPVAPRPGTPAPQPAPAPQPPAPAPQPQPQPEAPACEPEKEQIRMTNPQTFLEDLVKHPFAPLIGAGLLVVSYIQDEPTPPAISPELPEPLQKQVTMLFNQNQQKFARRMDLYRDLGMILLGYAGSRSIVDVIGQKHAHQLAAHASGDSARALAACSDKKAA